MDIRVLGAHRCESRDSGFISLLVDEVLAIDAGCLTSRLSFLAQQKLKAVLITHQHYDHVRDVPAIAMSFFLQGATINIYSTQNVCDALTTYLLNGKLYPKFHESPAANPTVKLKVIEPLKPEQIAGYSVLAVPVKHGTTTVGYQITSPDGGVVFYTGDTGPGLAGCWEYVSPQLLIIEVSAPNRYEQFARESGHLTPSLLQQELIGFRELKGYLPQVVAVHMDPGLEPEIATEIAAVNEVLNNVVTLGYEGMELHLGK